MARVNIDQNIKDEGGQKYSEPKLNKRDVKDIPHRFETINDYVFIVTLFTYCLYKRDLLQLSVQVVSFHRKRTYKSINKF